MRHAPSVALRAPVLALRRGGHDRSRRSSRSKHRDRGRALESLERRRGHQALRRRLGESLDQPAGHPTIAGLEHRDPPRQSSHFHQPHRLLGLPRRHDRRPDRPSLGIDGRHEGDPPLGLRQQERGLTDRPVDARRGRQQPSVVETLGGQDGDPASRQRDIRSSSESDSAGIEASIEFDPDRGDRLQRSGTARKGTGGRHEFQPQTVDRRLDQVPEPCPVHRDLRRRSRRPRRRNCRHPGGNDLEMRPSSTDRRRIACLLSLVPSRTSRLHPGRNRVKQVSGIRPGDLFKPRSGSRRHLARLGELQRCQQKTPFGALPSLRRTNELATESQPIGRPDPLPRHDSRLVPGAVEVEPEPWSGATLAIDELDHKPPRDRDLHHLGHRRRGRRRRVRGRGRDRRRHQVSAGGEGEHRQDGSPRAGHADEDTS